MKKKVFLILLVFVFLLGICSLSLAEENEVRLLVNGREIKPDVPAQIINGRVMVPVRWITTALKADIYWHEEQRTVEINRARTLASLPENKASLYPFKEEGGLYDGIILELGQERKYFDWKNSTNPTYCPQLYAADIDRDGEEEIIVVLTHGTGTGVHEEEVHVINPADFSEIAVENPLDIVTENVETSIRRKGEDVIVKIGLNERTALIKMKEEDSGCWGNDVFWGNVNHFYVSDNELRADIAAQVSASAFVGDVEIYYSFDGERFTMEDIEFAGYENYANSNSAAGTEKIVAETALSQPADTSDWEATRYKTVNNFEGVSMTVKEGTVSFRSLTVALENKSSSQCTYGEYFCLEKKINGSWYQLPVVIEGDYGFNDIGYDLAPGDNGEWATDWDWLYGSLDTGEYRMVKDILGFRGPGDYDTYYLAAEFTIY